MDLAAELATGSPAAGCRAILRWLGVEVPGPFEGREPDGTPSLLARLAEAAPALPDAMGESWRRAGIRQRGRYLVEQYPFPRVVDVDDPFGPVTSENPRLGHRKVAPLDRYVRLRLFDQAEIEQRFLLQGSFSPDVDPARAARRLTEITPGRYAGPSLLASLHEPHGSLWPRARLFAGAPRREDLLDLWDDDWGYAEITDHDDTEVGDGHPGA